MLRGLSTAASGMTADERLQQILANNLANSETPGFKSSSGELMSFPDQLLQSMNYLGTSSDGSTVGKMGTGVVMQEGVPLFIQGQLTQSTRNLDVAIVDNTPNGTYAELSNGGLGVGNITAGVRGRLEMNGVALQVTDGSGQTQGPLYAVKNPQYQGTGLVGSDGKPVYDENGNPSFVIENASGQVVSHAGQSNFANMGVTVGTSTTMGYHSFFAVAYQSFDGQKGIALTKDGSLDVNSNHELVDATGNTILPVDANGQLIPNGRIVINPNYTGAQLFGPNGEALTSGGQQSYQVLDANGQVIPNGRLGTVDVDVKKLSPLGQTEFMVNQSVVPQTVLSALRTGTGTIKPNQTEASNVDTTTTMTQMIAVASQYEANQKVIQSEDELLNKAVSDVGKVNA